MVTLYEPSLSPEIADAVEPLFHCHAYTGVPPVVFRVMDASSTSWQFRLTTEPVAASGADGCVIIGYIDYDVWWIFWMNNNTYYSFKILSHVIYFNILT